MENKCPVCGVGELERKSVDQTFTYKEQQFQYQQPGEWCNSCEEGILHTSDMNATELLLNDFRARVDGYLTSTDIKRIRNKLELTQKAASDIFGGGHNAFSRYETGTARQSKATDNLLRLLDKHPHLLNEIQVEKEESAA
jgi:HTH-type transcriptional regulator/antitoxin MqsA